MHKRRQVMSPNPPRGVMSRTPALTERRAVRRGSVRGVAARPSAGSAGTGCGAEHRWPEDAA